MCPLYFMDSFERIRTYTTIITYGLSVLQLEKL